MRHYAFLVTAAVAAGCPSAVGQGAMKLFGDPQVGFEIALPDACQHATRAGVIAAICAPGLDKLAKPGPAASAWMFEIDYEIAPADAAPFTEDAFKSELADTICGGGDADAVRITDVESRIDGTHAHFGATVTCPPLSALGLAERRAKARVVIAGAKRFRMMARSLAEEAERMAPLASTVFASLKVTGD